jgi:hypothetical protein
MPPLKFTPEITYAQSEAELDEQFESFRRGDLAYVRVRGLETERVYHTFGPRGIDPSRSAMGLMMDGVVEPLHGEYFDDIETLERIDGVSETPHMETVGGIEGKENQSIFSRVMRRVLGQ